MAEIEIEKIMINKNNPRYNFVRKEFNKSVKHAEQHINDAMSADNKLDNSNSNHYVLMNTIKNHGLINAIKIRPLTKKEKNEINETEPENKYEYLVIEGNTRLYAYKMLNKERDTEGKFNLIKADIDELKNDEEANKNDIKTMLLAHVVGTKPWRPYSEAKALAEWFDQVGEDVIESMCGGQTVSSKIKKQVKAYNHMNSAQKFWNADSSEYLGDDIGKDYSPMLWSWFEEFTQKKNVINKGLDEDEKLDDDTFSKLVAEGKLPFANNVRSLKDIWRDDTTRKILIENGYEKAKEHLIKLPTPNDKTKDLNILQLIQELKKRALEIEDDDKLVARLLKEHENIVDEIENIIGMLDTLKDNLTDNQEDK